MSVLLLEAGRLNTDVAASSMPGGYVQCSLDGVYHQRFRDERGSRILTTRPQQPLHCWHQ